ncbi:MAG: DUF981 domain-containing protein [Thermoplasmata archaeon]|nr:DUF981 domain-containing protein [Thermoplasmata archaeon]
MAFTPFVDDLGFIVALILAAAGVFTWVSVRAFLAIFRNDPKALRGILKTSAVPVGTIGVTSLLMGLYTEFTWPFLLSDGLGSYDIFFGDVLMIFAMVMIVYSVVAFFGLKLEYAGLFALIGGTTTAWYGYWGYTTLVKPGVLGLTKDPLETFLLYLAFAAAGFFALPASLAVDWYLEHPGPTWTPFRFALRPVAEMTAPVEGRFKLPISFYLATVWFPLFAFLAFVAAWFYMGSILPGHLTSPP